MAASVRYITYEDKTLLHNAAIVLSIVMLAVIGVNSFLAFMAPSWPIRLISFAGTLFGVCLVGCYIHPSVILSTIETKWLW